MPVITRSPSLAGGGWPSTSGVNGCPGTEAGMTVIRRSVASVRAWVMKVPQLRHRVVIIGCSTSRGIDVLPSRVEGVEAEADQVALDQAPTPLPRRLPGPGGQVAHQAQRLGAHPAGQHRGVAL